ncbi:MAG: hypothetical protein WC841_02195 [Candidatus Shapirobacteria bacterium]|jgi:tRNA G10  N-methylase Trm11
MTNNLYCFALGTNHSLCKVEIINVLYQKEISFEIIEASQETLIISTPIELDQVISINDFGSTAKLIKIHSSADLSDFFSTPQNILGPYLFPNQTSDHIQSGLSLYGAGCKYKDLNKAFSLTGALVSEIKKYLSKHNIKSNFLPIKERIIPTASVDNTKILSKGYELVVAVGKETIYVGKTIAIQDYKSYSFRDYERPARDSRSGMTPPKLAKMMVNLARKTTDQPLLDPFCGSGTYLMEMLLLGFNHITGSDIDPVAVENSKTNTEWVLKNYPQIDKSSEVGIFQSDAKKISQKIAKKSIDAVITEPYLGSPKAIRFNPLQISQEIKKLELLYLESFKEFSSILSKFGTIVIVFPVFKYKDSFYYLEIINNLKQIGFDQKNYLPDKYAAEQDKLHLTLTDRGTIVYYRPDQTVSREIIIFSKR